MYKDIPTMTRNEPFADITIISHAKLSKSDKPEEKLSEAKLSR